MDLASQLTLAPDVIKNLQESRREILIELLLDGCRVYTGGATYSLSIDLQGKLSVSVQADSRIANAEEIKSANELVAMWNAEHPDDPLDQASPSRDAPPAPLSAPPL